MARTRGPLFDLHPYDRQAESRTLRRDRYMPNKISIPRDRVFVSGVQVGTLGPKKSGARDLNAGRHGPEIYAVSSTETVFEGFGLNSSTEAANSEQFQPPTSPELLHELLHGTRSTARQGTSCSETDAPPGAPEATEEGTPRNLSQVAAFESWLARSVTLTGSPAKPLAPATIRRRYMNP